MTMTTSGSQLALPAKTLPKKERIHCTMGDKDLDLLIKICQIQSVTHNTERMRTWCRAFARALDGVKTQRHEGNLYITKGKADTYPCFVAHLDTVHAIVPDEEYQVYWRDENHDELVAFNPVKNKWQGIGGDDKVGIFIALKMLVDLPVCKVALFRDEERGCLGANKADLSFFADCRWAIECDRRDNGDVIRSAAGTELHGQEFADAIKPAMDFFGYKNAYGSLTDVRALKELGVNISMCNISCGYYNAHSAMEYIHVDDVARCLEFVRMMTETLGDTVYEHTYVKPVYTPVKRYTPKPNNHADAGDWIDEANERARRNGWDDKGKWVKKKR